ncbi:MAG: GvpL/GvpF family gas vesicle protein [Candidatus Thermoplasmatota archaeon]|nr:GvpL/GvpF family gas vesicle protein [Candidatus Thermoplasmatota archaeon]
MARIKLKPLEKLEIIGKRSGEEPFSVSGQRGLYLYIRTEDFDKLSKINKLCKSLPELAGKTLESVKIIGRGSFPGYRPFLVKGQEGSWLCILAEHFRQLKELNSAYRRVLEVEERRKEAERKRREAELRKKLEEKRLLEEERKKKLERARKKREAERKKKLEEERRLEEERKLKLEEVRKKKVEEKRKKAKNALTSLRKAVEEAREAKALKYVPEIMQEVEKSFAEIKKVFSAAKYDKTIKLIPKAVELASYAKSEAERKLKLKVPEGKYLYGIIPAPEKEIRFGNIGIGDGSRVYTINYKDLAAVVSDTPVKDYSVTEEYSRTHEGVVRKVLEKYSIVPAAFGQVFKNPKILRVLIKKAYKALKECTKLIDNKVELGVKAIVPKQAVKSLDDKKKIKLKNEGEKIFNTLTKKAAEAVRGRLFSDRLILNASYLVPKHKIKDFSKEIGQLSERYKDLILKYSGPWPPYSFVCVKIGAKGIEVGRKEVS